MGNPAGRQRATGISDVSDKKIILIMPPDFGVYQVIEQNLRYMGFEQVTVISPLFRYKTKDRILNFIQML